jgi:hypothetical protein
MLTCQEVKHVDPITLIVTALAAGAGEALQDNVKDTVKAAYVKLRGLVKLRLEGHSDGELALEGSGAAAEKWKAFLVAELKEAGAADDPDLVLAASDLMSLIDPVGVATGKYEVQVINSYGVQVGDHNYQKNTF